MHEETGLRCIVGHQLPDAIYIDRKGRDKRVRYWTMQAMTGEFRRNREVDEICWVCLDDAARRLTYARDAVVVHSLRGTLIDAA